MSFVFTRALARLSPDVLVTGNIRVALLRVGTAAPTSRDAGFVSDIVPLEEFDGSGYARLPVPGRTLTPDDTEGVMRWTFTPIMWENIGGGTGAIAGVLFILTGTSDADSRPLIWVDRVAFPFTHVGGFVTLQAPDGGLLRVRSVDLEAV